MATHHCTLVERHAFYVPVPRPLPSGEARQQLRQKVWNDMTKLAEKWADGEGLAIEVEPYEQQDRRGEPSAWGVRYTVMVGRGVEATDGRRADPWTWSDRWTTWLSRFRRMERPHMKSIDGGQLLPFRRGRGA